MRLCHVPTLQNYGRQQLSSSDKQIFVTSYF